MACVEEKAFRLWHVTKPPPLYARFLDDIFMIWEDSDHYLDLYLQHLNSILPTIDLTISSSKEEIDFLDLTIYKGQRFAKEGILDVRPYFKPTASFSYLHYRSCHSPRTFANVVKEEAIRLLRNTSDPSIFSSEIGRLITRFHKRGYPIEFIHSSMVDVTFSARSNYLAIKEDPVNLQDCTTYMSVRQNPALPSGMIYSVLDDDELPFETRITRKRADSIGDQLVSSKSSTRKEMRLRSGRCIPWTTPESRRTAAAATAAGAAAVDSSASPSLLTQPPLQQE